MRPLPLSLSLSLSLISRHLQGDEDEEEADYKQLARWTKIRLVAPRKNLISPLYPAKVSQTIFLPRTSEKPLKKVNEPKSNGPRLHAAYLLELEDKDAVLRPSSRLHVGKLGKS